MTTEEIVEIDALHDAQKEIRRVRNFGLTIYAMGGMFFGLSLGASVYYFGNCPIAWSAKVGAFTAVASFLAFSVRPTLHYNRVLRHFSKVEAQVKSGIEVALSEALYKNPK
jgi:membrane protein YdbS with pleckstrin-like domain